MSFLELSDITKRFGTFEALRGISLSIERGTFVSLLGPSGCGKTTLLRIIAGLETPNGGSVVIDGSDVTRLPPEARRLAMMFQSYALLPHMTVLGNVRFPLRMQGSSSTADQRQRAHEALALVKLDHLADSRPRQLSGGQQQRVALARAIVYQPRVLLLDEPLSNLDARLREDMQIELQDLHRRLGLTTIFVTHDQEEALSLSDRVVLMRDGSVERDAPADEIYDDPGTPFAADFLGAANVVQVSVDPGGVQLADGQVLNISAPNDSSLLVMRQEDLRLGGDGLSFHGVVEARVFMGTRVRYVVRVGGAKIRLLVARDAIVAPGDQVMVTIEPDRVRWAQAGQDG
ncbi:MAG: ABC transporter ATP-binding protein [Pseudomonadota bacterium]